MRLRNARERVRGVHEVQTMITLLLISVEQKIETINVKSMHLLHAKQTSAFTVEADQSCSKTTRCTHLYHKSLAVIFQFHVLNFIPILFKFSCYSSSFSRAISNLVSVLILMSHNSQVYTPVLNVKCMKLANNAKLVSRISIT